MVRKGDIIYNPVSGETYTYLKTGADTNGSLLQIDVTLAPGGGQWPTYWHIHPKQQEIICIRNGKMTATINGINKIYSSGDTIVIPAGVPHHWANASNHEELQFVWELTPAMFTETILETMTALSQAGKLTRRASVPFLQLALTLTKYPHHFTRANSLGWLQQLLFWVVTPIALLLGYAAEIDYKEVIASKGLPVVAQP